MLNKNAIEKMLEMPDDKFIMMLNLVLGSAGIDILVSKGGTTVLTEVPEMFGAETLLMNRCGVTLT